MGRPSLGLFGVLLAACLSAGSIGHQAAPVRSSWISGHVRLSPGTEHLRLELTSISVSEQHGDSYSYSIWLIAHDGSFLIPKLVPGSYGLKVEGRAPGQGRGVLKAAAVRIVDASHGAVSDVDLQLLPVASASGVVLVDGPQAPDPDDVQVLLSPEGPAPYLRQFFDVGSRNPEAFRFHINGIMGVQRLVATTPDGWIVESVVLDDGTDITDRPYVFEPGRHYSNIRVALTNRCASISATVAMSPSWDPRNGVVVTAFPEDRSKRYGWSRFVRSSHDATFQITGLPPGEAYFVAAHRWGLPIDETALAALEATAARVYIDRPATFHVDLTATR